MRKRSYRHINAEHRETLRLAWSLARVLGRAPYHASTVQALAVARARQPWRPRKPPDPWLWQDVKTHLAEGCSLKQIAGRLQRARILMTGENTSRPRLSMWA